MNQYSQISTSTKNLIEEIQQLIEAVDPETAEQTINDMIQVNGKLAEIRANLTYQLMKKGR